jgi:hypothetical protein
MAQPNYRDSALYEHRFWLQVLGDHSRFLIDSLPSRNVQEVQIASHFIERFDQLLAKARTSLQEPELVTLSQEAFGFANELRAFKLHLLRRLLQGENPIQLPETFLSHMVNEIEEYIRNLGYLVNGQAVPLFHPIHHHMLWLPDAAGHAAIIHDKLDPVEKRMRKTSMKFTNHFEQFYIKAVELAGYLRSTLPDFPALQRFHQDAALEVCLFDAFLREMEELNLQHRVLGTLSPLLPDHMMREACYYLTKLAQVSEVNTPDCDPTKPRQE